MAAIGATCSRKFGAAHKSGIRSLTDIRWVVIHCTEGSTAAGAASWFQNPASGGSAHLVIDDEDCFRTLLDGDIPWGAEGANSRGFHIEIAGFARWKREDWLAKDRRLRRAAFKTAYHCVKFKIPLRWVSPTKLRLGWKGIATHADCCKAFGGTHWDPGAGFPKDKFLALVKQYAAEIRSL